MATDSYNNESMHQCRKRRVLNNNKTIHNQRPIAVISATAATATTVLPLLSSPSTTCSNSSSPSLSTSSSFPSSFFSPSCPEPSTSSCSNNHYYPYSNNNNNLINSTLSSFNPASSSHNYSSSSPSSIDRRSSHHRRLMMSWQQLGLVLVVAIAAMFGTTSAQYPAPKDEYFINTPYGMCVPGLVFRVAAQAGEIMTPGYPDEYPPKQDCRWLIDVSDVARPDRVAVLKFIDFRIETLCQSERVEIYDGPDLSSPLLAKICGNIDSYDDVKRYGGDGKRSWYNQTLVDLGFIGDDGWSYFASSTVMLVRFVTDNVWSYRGFRAIYFGEDTPAFIKALRPKALPVTTTTQATTTKPTSPKTTPTTTKKTTTKPVPLPDEDITTKKATTTPKQQPVAPPKTSSACYAPGDRLPPAAYNMRSTAFQFLVEPSIPCDGVIDSVEFVSTQSRIDFILLVLRRYQRFDWLRSNQTYWLLAYRNISTANSAIRPFTWTSVNVADPISVNQGDLIGFMYHSIFVNHDTAPVIPHAMTMNRSYAGYAELWDWNVLTDFILHPDKAGDSPLKRPLFDLHEVSSLNRPFRVPAIRVRVSQPEAVKNLRSAVDDSNYPMFYDAPANPQMVCDAMLLPTHNSTAGATSEPCDASSNTLTSRIYYDPNAGQCSTTYDCSSASSSSSSSAAGGSVRKQEQLFFRTEEECSATCGSYIPMQRS